VNTLNLITKATLATLLIVGLGACGKKSGGTKAGASSGYVTCPPQGYYTNPATGQTQYCQAGQQVFVGTAAGQGGQQLCPQQGYVQTQYGMQRCTPGQYVQVGQQYPGGQIPGQYPGGQIPGQYPGGYQQQQNGCQQWTQMYGVPYYPQMMGGQMVCVRGY